jgi:hypothetical protein
MWRNGLAVFLPFSFLSAISVLEIERGASQISRKKEAKGKILRIWIDDHILARFESRILAVDSAVALRYQ